MLPPLNKANHKRKWQQLQQTYANAMWMWSEIESAIFAVYVAAIGGMWSDHGPIKAAFFAINSFEMRLKMTHEAMAERWQYNKTIWSVWVPIHAGCIAANGQRGKIAHKTGLYYAPEEPHQQHLYVLADPFWHSKAPEKWGIAKSVGIDADKLIIYEKDWALLQYEIAKLSEKLWQPGAFLQTASRQRRRPHKTNVRKP